MLRGPSASACMIMEAHFSAIVDDKKGKMLGLGLLC